MKQRICSVILCAVLALQPCMAEAAQGRAQAAEAAGRDDSPQVRLADETDGEAVNPGVEKAFTEEAPITSEITEMLHQCCTGYIRNSTVSW